MSQPVRIRPFTSDESDVIIAIRQNPEVAVSKISDGSRSAAQTLRRAGIIENSGSNMKPHWVLLRHAEGIAARTPRPRVPARESTSIPIHWDGFQSGAMNVDAKTGAVTLTFTKEGVGGRLADLYTNGVLKSINLIPEVSRLI